MSRIPVPASPQPTFAFPDSPMQDSFFTPPATTPTGVNPLRMSTASPYGRQGTPTRRTESIHSASQLSSNAGLSDTRQRQSKRDEAIRKKIESELSRKRPTSKRGPAPPGGGGSSRNAPRPKQGTVSALRPLPALTVPHTISVADASQLCAAKRTDCVLVVDEDEHLCGIFTAKDLAFRVIGDGLDPRATPVSAIMTPNPMVTRDSTSATEALQTMVTRGFRHLPVCNEDGDVVGLLDITKVFHESLEKLEKAYGSSQKLYTALEGVQSSWGPQGSANGLMQYVEALRDKMSFPDLGSILDARTAPATVGTKATVRDAARLMRERRTTAVCVMEGDRIAGIFTSKDVVLRVIAAGLEARTCSVVRVMTPHPDTGLPSLSIQDALRKMHDGHYLNLPVVNDAGTLVGIVDVLKLTYATLEQVNSISTEGADPSQAGGPLWARFFGGLGGDDADTESVLSAENNSAAPITPSRGRSDSALDTPGSELFPNDSASMFEDELRGSELGRRAPKNASSLGGIPNGADKVVDDGTYLFKFVAPGGTTHRFQARYDSFDFIIDIIAGKLSSDPFFAPSSTPPSLIADDSSEVSAAPTILDPRDFQLFYHDDDGDLVMITADHDVTDAVKVAKAQGKDRVVVSVRGGKAWDEELAKRAPAPAPKKEKPKPALPALAEGEEDDGPKGVDEDGEVPVVVRKKKAKAAADDDLVFGVLPKEMLLPASVAFLAVTIAGVFTISRVTAGGR